MHLNDDDLRTPPLDCHPEVRWWLAEGLHTDRTLHAEVEAVRRLGFGGIEFLAMDEPGIDQSRYGWGSEEWVHDAQVITDVATEHQLAVSFTSGTNWANANLPGIDADHPAASKELDVAVETLQPGATRRGLLVSPPWNGPRPGGDAPTRRVPGQRESLVAVIALPVLELLADGARLAASEALELTGRVRDGELVWSVPDGRTWQVHTFWMRGTGQIADPSATTNFTVNYIDPDGCAAVIDYWSKTLLTPALRARIAENPRVQMYMDSLELFTWGHGGMFWGSTLMDEFARRRGYEIQPWLPFLTRVVPNFAAGTTYRNEPDETHRLVVDKVRHDYVRTLTDLYIENMLAPLRSFLHENGMGLRAEISYGMPFELSRPGVEVDGIETESLEFGSQIDAYRMLAGVAHLFGKQYSSETGATTRNHMLDHRFYDQIIATQFAAGISRTMMHGWASTAGAEGVTEWPGHTGMYAMFSERFDLRQPGAEFYPLWNEAMGRVQLALRCGQPRIDVGILRTDHFIDNLSGMHFVRDGKRIADEVIYGSTGMRDRDNYWWQDLGMQDAGWTYEFLDGSLLINDAVAFDEGVVQPDGPAYQALVVYQEALDPDVAWTLLQWARQGLRVLLVDDVTELAHLSSGRYTHHARAAVRTPGLDGRDDELVATIAQLCALTNVTRITAASETVPALRTLGVIGRAEFASSDRSVLTHLRNDGATTVLYAYNFLYEGAETARVDALLEGHGRVERLDHWSGERVPYPSRVQGERTVIPVALRPGEIAVFTLDREAPRDAAEPIARRTESELSTWEISIESWDAGGTEIIAEDRGLGYETREAQPRTDVRCLAVLSSGLAPWKDLPGIGHEVSGVGEYRSGFQLDEVEPGRRYLVDLGSTAGGLGSVRINGSLARGFDTSSPVVDITDAVQNGRNTIVVRVSSSLNNRLLARGYYDELPDIAVPPVDGAFVPHETSVRTHGLLGPVRVLSEG